MDNQQVDVLMVEDNMEDAELTIRALKKNKLINSLMHLTDGAQALEFIFGTGEYAQRNINHLPKLILLDLKMPKVSGIEVLERVKSNPGTRTIPIVILTSSAEDPDIKRCYELGANSYIVKPVEFGNFSKTVSELGFYWLMVNHA